MNDDENKQFDYDLILPKGGKIDGIIFENDYVDIPMTLFYNIEIKLIQFFYKKISLRI